MKDSELRKLLIETCPVRPGQEDRAWSVLRERLFDQPVVVSPPFWKRLFDWPVLTASMAVAACLLFIGYNVIESSRPGQPAPLDEALNTAKGDAPGVYATCYYSAPAHAQVVWLKGLDPIGDQQPTYLDPTTVITGPTDDILPSSDLNNL